MEALSGYGWPGNVRELRTAVEHAVVLCRGEIIGLRDLPPSVRRSVEEGSGMVGEGGIPSLVEPGELTVREAERQLIIRALRESNGNRTEAARRIGVSRRTLHRKLHTYQLEDL
jgi:DNA-binding NtrC family response regulator